MKGSAISMWQVANRLCEVSDTGTVQVWWAFIAMTAALKGADEYERLAGDCEQAYRLTRLTAKRDFYTRRRKYFVSLRRPRNDGMKTSCELNSVPKIFGQDSLSFSTDQPVVLRGAMRKI